MSSGSHPLHGSGVLLLCSHIRTVRTIAPVLVCQKVSEHSYKVPAHFCGWHRLQELFLTLHLFLYMCSLACTVPLCSGAHRKSSDHRSCTEMCGLSGHHRTRLPYSIAYLVHPEVQWLMDRWWNGGREAESGVSIHTAGKQPFNLHLLSGLTGLWQTRSCW